METGVIEGQGMGESLRPPVVMNRMAEPY